jgi:hypothetical protein
LLLGFCCSDVCSSDIEVLGEKHYTALVVDV